MQRASSYLARKILYYSTSWVIYYVFLSKSSFLLSIKYLIIEMKYLANESLIKKERSVMYFLSVAAKVREY